MLPRGQPLRRAIRSAHSSRKGSGHRVETWEERLVRVMNIGRKGMSWRKVWSRTLVACMAIMMLGTSVRADNSIGFTDERDDAYYAEAIRWAIGQGITNGISNNKFGTGMSVTRGQAVTFLWRSCGQKDPTTKVNPFKDVKESDYYYKAVLWAVENGITNGVGNNQFNPTGNVTRGQLITFLYRTLGIGADGWYEPAGTWAKDAGLLDGLTLTVAPEVDCPRACVVLFLFRQLAK